MKWPAYWMMTLAVIHSSLAMVLYGQTYSRFFSDGFFGAVANDLDRLAVWFLVAGGLMFLIGNILLNTEVASRSVGVTLGLIAIAGGLLIPASGFWLILPPALGIALNQKSPRVISPTQ